MALSEFQSCSLDLRQVTDMATDAAQQLLRFQGHLQIKLHTLSDETRNVIETHQSVKTWGVCEGPYVNVVCKNCGEKERLEFQDSEDTVWALFGGLRDGGGPKWGGWFWCVCPDCCGELSEEQIEQMTDLFG